MKKLPDPTPCVVTKYVDGKPVAQEVVIRPVLLDVRDKKEPERTVRKFRVMAEQETGEKVFVGYAEHMTEANDLIALHKAQHPEHRSCWFERI